jgi:hypothetical protein
LIGCFIKDFSEFSSHWHPFPYGTPVLSMGYLRNAETIPEQDRQGTGTEAALLRCRCSGAGPPPSSDRAAATQPTSPGCRRRGRTAQRRPNGAVCPEAPLSLTRTTVLMPSGLSVR